MGSSLTRRELVKLTGGVALGAGLSSQLLTGEARGANTGPRLAGWLDGGDLVMLGTPSSDPTLQTQHAVLMPVATKLAAPFDAWYLWVWTHDTASCRLYSAPSPNGFFAFRGFCNFPAVPAGWDPRQFSAGDVVWDPQGQRFYSTPHAMWGPDGHFQATFLITSLDGVNWSFVTTEPMLSWGAPGSFDDHQVSYGRFLRDYRGNLHRLADGRIVFYYRGESQPTPDLRLRQIGAATSRDLQTWTKVSDRPLFIGNNGQNIVPGSALQVGDTTYLVLATMDCPQPECTSLLSATMYLKQAATAGSPFLWLDGMGAPMYHHARAPAIDGGSYVVDGDRHYMAFAVISTDPTKPFRVAGAHSDG